MLITFVEFLLYFSFSSTCNIIFILFIKARLLLDKVEISRVSHVHVL